MTLAARLRRPATIRMILVTAGFFGWAAFAALTSQMYGAGAAPHGAGFDLELLITGGRHVAAGISPYDPAMLAGRSVEIASLFYSYPPIVAQVLAPISFLPSVVVFAATVAIASVAAVVVARAVATAAGNDAIGRATLLPIAALLPFWFPYTVGMLFGNVDIFFPALYGLVLLGVLQPAGTVRSERWVVAGGIALALASITKLHPAVLGIWLLFRGLVERRRGTDLRRVGPLTLPRSWRIAGVAAVAVAAALALSLVLGGVQPWLDYVSVLRAGASVDLLDPRNIGPAVQVVMLFGLGPGAVGPIQLGFLALALVVTVWAALRVDDPLESLAWAAAASFIVLPVTWFHHFAALVPFGIAALARGTATAQARGQESAPGAAPDVARRLWLLVLAGFAIVMIGFAQPPTWLLVPVFLAAARISRPRGPDPTRRDAVRRAPPRTTPTRPPAPEQQPSLEPAPIEP